MSSYYNLGDYSRLVTTQSAVAQRWFDRGLVWLYGFNHEESIRCFEKAVGIDPTCAMAWWGIAYAHGPYINKEWRFYAADELAATLKTVAAAIEQAQTYVVSGTAVEQALVGAIGQRYQSETAVSLPELNSWHDDYAAAMADVYAQFPDDLDVIALYAEAMMMRTPWKLWDVVTGEPMVGADTLTMTAVLERGMSLVEAQNLPPHPGIAHMYIHTMEMSPFPERALRAADGLRNLVPDSGHLNHMPSHIDVLCGHYYEAVVASEKAIAADNKYLAQIGRFGQYTAACCHDHHLMMFAAMFLGQFRPAIASANAILDLVTPDVLRAATPAFAITLEAYHSMKMHVLIRFGKWEEIFAAPLPAEPDLYCVTTAMHHYAKAIARAMLGDFVAAAKSRDAFEATVAMISPERHLFNNTSHAVLAVARQMMLGEMAYHQGDYGIAFAHLREAVRLNDNLHYTEPWAWMHPPRHALGALLLAQGQLEEAERVYEADLGLTDGLSRCSVHPDNVWSLHGYVECLERLGKTAVAAAFRPRLNIARARADTPITASCACRVELPSCSCTSNC
ncbi:MAG: hypothetical protein AAF614_09805 [Chloroflexota bacterium]